MKINAKDAELLRIMADNSGVIERGGLAIRRFDERGIQYQNEVLGRTAWIGQPEFARGFGMGKDAIMAAVEKAIAGRKLGSRQALLLEGMLAEIVSMRELDDLEDRAGAVDQAAPFDLEDYDEEALERAAIQAEAGCVEERHAALRDRDTCILSSPPGTAPAALLRPQPTAQVALFAASVEKQRAPESAQCRPRQAAKPDSDLPDDRSAGPEEILPAQNIVASIKRKPGRPRSVPGRFVLVKLEEADILRAKKAGGGKLAAGIRALIRRD